MDGLLPITLKPSRGAFYLAIAAALLAVLAVWLSGLDALVKSLLTALLVWVIAHRQAGPPVTLGCTNGQWWLLDQGCHHRVPVERRGDLCVLAWLVVMKYRRSDNGKTLVLALWPDSADSEELRRLRVFLRYGKYG